MPATDHRDIPQLAQAMLSWLHRHRRQVPSPHTSMVTVDLCDVVLSYPRVIHSSFIVRPLPGGEWGQVSPPLRFQARGSDRPPSCRDQGPARDRRFQTLADPLSGAYFRGEPLHY